MRLRRAMLTRFWKPGLVPLVAHLLTISFRFFLPSAFHEARTGTASARALLLGALIACLDTDSL